jgi:hypothetical protein
MLTSRTRTRLLNSRPTKPCSWVPVPSVSRAVLSPVVSLTFPPPALGEDLETYEGAFTIFCTSESPSKRDEVSR